MLRIGYIDFYTTPDKYGILLSFFTEMGYRNESPQPGTFANLTPPTNCKGSFETVPLAWSKFFKEGHFYALYHRPPSVRIYRGIAPTSNWPWSRGDRVYEAAKKNGGISLDVVYTFESDEDEKRFGKYKSLFSPSIRFV